MSSFPNLAKFVINKASVDPKFTDWSGIQINNKYLGYTFGRQRTVTYVEYHIIRFTYNTIHSLIVRKVLNFPIKFALIYNDRVKNIVTINTFNLDGLLIHIKKSFYHKSKFILN